MRRLFTRSLARRLVLSSLLAALLLLVLAGFLLTWMFRATLERQFDARLDALLNGLLVNVEQRPDGSIVVVRDLADPSFQLPASGWYWQITPLSADAATSPKSAPALLPPSALPRGHRRRSLASPSLLEKRFDLHQLNQLPRQPDGTLRATIIGPHGWLVRITEQRLSLFGDDNRHSILVAGDAAFLKHELRTFGQVMIAMFVLFGIGLALSILLQVRYGLRPLKTLHDEIAEVRDGRRQSLQGDFPDELQPVVEEMNKLIRSNREVLERARTQVGNLAHALKTPLSVLMNEARARQHQEEQKEMAQLVLQQSKHMRQQVDLYLERARRAALAGTLGTVTPVAETLRPIINALSRIYSQRAVKVDVDCPQALQFRGEKQDLEEMLGNLLDNAFKYGGAQVRVQCAMRDGMLRLTIEDDGPGLDAEQRQKALQRGQRLDEARPGSGLGLSIVKELAEMYQGRLQLDDSPLGGLKVVLWLPAVSLRKA